MTIKPILLLLLLAGRLAYAGEELSRQPETLAPPQEAESTQKHAALPAQPLTEQLLYQFLLGEIAGQRGDLGLASEAYLDLARKTRDPRVAKRATEIAVYARRSDMAEPAARLWLELEPDSPAARQNYLLILLGSGKFDEAKPFLQNILKTEGRTPAEMFMQVHALLVRHPDRQAVLGLMEDLVKDYADVPEAQFVLAQAAWQAGKGERAQQALNEVLRLRPGWEMAGLFYGQTLEPKGEAAILRYWRSFLDSYPNSRAVRLAYAKLLAKTGRYADARDELDVLYKQGPAHPEVPVTLGLLAMQMGDLDGASGYFREALNHPQADKNLVRTYLAQLEEMRKNDQAALAWYEQVGEGQHYLQARLRAAFTLGRLNRIVEARALLKALTPANDVERVQVIQTEAQILREARDYQGTYDVLSAGLSAMPESEDLLYDRAMAAERTGHLDVLERDLRKLISLRPDHAHAYNALGYTLADRTARVDEALQLLEQALKLAPGDPFIMDSMGWALFKAKRFDEAVDFLRRAMAVRPDPEIAAHLGETLWVKGEREEARQILQSAAKENPNSEVLQDTMTRLRP